MENNENKDPFEEARMNSIKSLIDKQSSSVEEVGLTVKQKDAIILRSKETLEDGETQWDLLKKMVEGSLTERFIQVLQGMPDRDFARNYLKLLEYYKPKITRTEGGTDEDKDITVNVQMVIMNEKGEQEVVTIEELKQKQIKE